MGGGGRGPERPGEGKGGVGEVRDRFRCGSLGISSLEVGGSGGVLAGWAVAEVVPVNPPPAAGWKALEVCCFVMGEGEPLLCAWRACCPREEVVEGLVIQGPAWGRGQRGPGERRGGAREVLAHRACSKAAPRFPGKGVWGLPALLGIPGCADSTEWVLAYLVPEGEGYLVLSPHQASGRHSVPGRLWGPTPVAW